MPRVNPLRTLTNERNLASRLQHEREAREWSYEGFAHRMGEAGYPIQSSAIFKIEKGDPPRRITVDELVGFATVLDLTLEELLQPPALAAQKQLRRLLENMSRATEATLAADGDYKRALHALAAYADKHPDVIDNLGPDAATAIRDAIATLAEVDADIDKANRKGRR